MQSINSSYFFPSILNALGLREKNINSRIPLIHFNKLFRKGNMKLQMLCMFGQMLSILYFEKVYLNELNIMRIYSTIILHY